MWFIVLIARGDCCIQDLMVFLRVTGYVQNVEIQILPFEPLVICASVELQSLLRM